jgi:hypothetical protein
MVLSWSTQAIPDDAIKPAELARLQQVALASALDQRPLEPGGAPVRLPDLQFARQGGAIALSPENLAPGVDVDALPGPVQLTRPEDAREAKDESGKPAATAGGYLAFKAPVVEGDRLTLGLEVRAFPPGGDRAVPISALSLHFARQGDAWVPDAPPAALSS